ncbi:hypothetical protein BDV26DRAFT_252101 [Aspergillus bertholletiae]|uniref:Uncharacterized protein n=1 Tax=Aspergillus bertholletiae TaxID=1226010 RepID=A0A5N7BN39_9EURO|nr:hypothetical protein BDV26DRAFT_252101 [Aspergillus bertholletiae]
MAQNHPISLKSLRCRLSRHFKPKSSSSIIIVSSSSLPAAEGDTIKPLTRRKSAREIRKAAVNFLAELGGATRITPIDEDSERCSCGRCFGRTPQGRYGSFLTGRDLDDTRCLLRPRPAC